jgi:uroporphyrinogen-III decarboxylase
VISDDDIPSGSVLWLFDQTDMRAAKRALEGRACIAGNVPGALPAIGTPQDVQAYVEDLLNDVATEGGVVLMTGAVIDDAKPETIKAMIETGRKWDG